MILAVVIFAAFSLIALISGMVAKERQREIGLFMSMGAKRNIIFSLIIGESLILAAIGGIAGVCVSLAAFFLLNAQGLLTNALQVSFRMPSVGRNQPDNRYNINHCNNYWRSCVTLTGV